MRSSRPWPSSSLVAGARGNERRSLEAWWCAEITRINGFNSQTELVSKAKQNCHPAVFKESVFHRVEEPNRRHRKEGLSLLMLPTSNQDRLMFYGQSLRSWGSTTGRGGKTSADQPYCDVTSACFRAVGGAAVQRERWVLSLEEIM